MLDTSTTTWDAERVRRALARAYRVLNASEGRVGHKRLRAAWPEHAIEWEDLVAQQEHKTARKTEAPRMRPTSIDIARMEMVLLGTRDMPAWLNGRVRSYPTGRKMLVASVMAASHRYSGRQLCEAFGWAEATFRWQRDKAAAIIAEELNADGLEAW
jgi:hypothetical protein